MKSLFISLCPSLSTTSTTGTDLSSIASEESIHSTSPLYHYASDQSEMSSSKPAGLSLSSPNMTSNMDSLSVQVPKPSCIDGSFTSSSKTRPVSPNSNVSLSPRFLRFVYVLSKILSFFLHYLAL